MNINKLDAINTRRSRHSRLTVLIVFALMAALAAVDLIEDLAQGTTVTHIMVESLVILTSLIIATTVALILIRDAMEFQSANRDLRRNLEVSLAAAEAWRKEAQNLLLGLGSSINSQFDDWHLTTVEKEIALFLLKGLSHKEVAYIRGVSDATVRQQSRAVYKKSGVTGRHGLAAFFLEDLALPIDNDHSSRRPGTNAGTSTAPTVV